MTKDTERALAIIKPLADELGFELDADDNMLYVGALGIGIACNSTYATIMEFIGLVFDLDYDRKFRSMNLKESQREIIRRYWFTPKQLEKLKAGRSKDE